jgi:hypothetical protein
MPCAYSTADNISPRKPQVSRRRHRRGARMDAGPLSGYRGRLVIPVRGRPNLTHDHGYRLSASDDVSAAAPGGGQLTAAAVEAGPPGAVMTAAAATAPLNQPARGRRVVIVPPVRLVLLAPGPAHRVDAGAGLEQGGRMRRPAPGAARAASRRLPPATVRTGPGLIPVSSSLAEALRHPASRSVPPHAGRRPAGHRPGMSQFGPERGAVALPILPGAPGTALKRR